ncbi:hypothetical protein ACGC1H_004555 [Rhizoctonia solani]
MRSPIIRRQDPTATPTDGSTQTSEPTSQSQSPEGTTTPRTSNSPSQATSTISSAEGTTPTSSRITTSNATTTPQTPTSVPPTTTQLTTSRTNTSNPQTPTSSPGTSTSPTNQSTTPSASVITTQSEITRASSPLVTSSTSTVSTSTNTSLSTISSTTSISSNLSSSTSDTQTSSSASISSSPTDASTSPTSTAIITTSVSASDTSHSPTPTPTPTPTSSTTSARDSSTTSDSASSSTLTSVLVTTVATVNGQPTTITTIVPTLAAAPEGPSGLSVRSSKIVGGVIGGTLALLGVLLTLFYISRRRRKAAAFRDAPRLQAPRQMLDADDFDLAEPGPTPYPYGMVGARANPNASGSIFHEALPGTSTQPSHSYSRSVVSENDPLLAHHMRGGSADIDSVATSSPRESTHLRTSSTTGLLYDPNDPFGDPPPRSVGSSSSRSHPLAVTKALEARSRGSDQHVYPPSSFRGPINTEPLATSSPVLVHQDAGRIDILDSSAPPTYGNGPR